jgi:dolichol-phosphate hexosyltransferase
LSNRFLFTESEDIFPDVITEEMDSSAAQIKPSLFDALVNECPVKTSIIIPAYNEEEAIPLVLKSLINVVDDSYEIIIVDDGSTDNSVNEAIKFPCRVVRHSHNAGKGTALQTGLNQARGEYAIFIDADNTYPVELIPTLVEALDEHDLVRGVRISGRENIPFLNRMGNQLFDRVIQSLHAVEGGDLLSGMYGGHVEKLLELDLESKGFDIEAEINVKAKARGLTCATVPITYLERVGNKKLRAFHDGLRILYRLMQLTISYNPLLVFILPGVALFLLAVVGVLAGLMPPDRIGDPALMAQSSFALGIVGTIGAQLIIFGLAVYSAGMAYGLRGRANQNLDTLARFFRARWTRLAGFIMLVTGSAIFIGLTLVRILNGGVSPFSPAVTVLSSFFMLIGMQILSATAFLSALNALQLHMNKIKKGSEE